MELLGTNKQKYKMKNPLVGINRNLETLQKISKLEDIKIETKSNELHFHFKKVEKK